MNNVAYGDAQFGAPADFDVRYTTNVPGVTTPVNILPGNPYRIYLGVSTASSAGNLSFDLASFTAQTAMFVIPLATTPVEFFWERHRALVTKPVWILAGTVTGRFNLVEVVRVPRG